MWWASSRKVDGEREIYRHKTILQRDLLALPCLRFPFSTAADRSHKHTPSAAATSHRTSLNGRRSRSEIATQTAEAVEAATPLSRPRAHNRIVLCPPAHRFIIAAAQLLIKWGREGGGRTHVCCVHGHSSKKDTFLWPPFPKSNLGREESETNKKVPPLP